MRNGKDSFEQRLDDAVTYFLNMGMNLNGSYQELWPTERATAMYALLLAGRRLNTLMAQAVRKQACSVVDVTGLDLVETRGRLLNLLSYLEHGDCDLQISYSYNQGATPIYVPCDIVEEENLDLQFPVYERSKDYTQARALLITRANAHYQELLSCIKEVIGQLEKLIDDAKNLKRNPELQSERMAAMETYYAKHLWPQHKAELEAQIDAALNDEDNKGLTPTKIIKAMIKDMYADYERHHDEQTFDDMMRQCQHRASIKWLNYRIESISLLVLCDAYDGKLFTSKAAYELAKLLGKAFYNYVAFDKKRKASFVHAAMKDLGLVMKDENNAKLMADFINHEYLGDNDDTLKDDDVTVPQRKANHHPFCTLDENNLRSYGIKEFERYKETYWRAYSIINKVIGVGEKIEKAAYLAELHPIIAENDVLDYLSDKEKSRLRLINSVAKQNWG